MDDSKPVMMTHIVRAAELSTGVTLKELRSDRRTHPLVQIRHAVCIIAAHRTNLSIAGIGRYLNRDHTSVLHAIGARRGAKRKHYLTEEYLARIDRALLDVIARSPKHIKVAYHLPQIMPSRASLKWGAVP